MKFSIKDFFSKCDQICAVNDDQFITQKMKFSIKNFFSK